jgi:para-nitrobenzyl esterase
MSRCAIADRIEVSRRIVKLVLVTAALVLDLNAAVHAQTTAALNDPIKTEGGYVSGAVIGELGKEVRIYKGIPYAAPPVGEMRWRPPQPARPWQGVRKSTEFGPIAPQNFLNSPWKFQESQMDEDCLTLNVLTPTKTGGAALPVMVWLHPGGLDTGSANLPIYNSPALPQHGVVLVTVNHRLGALGLLVYPGLWEESPHNAAGNYGMLDLVAALQWVRRNIAAFGGDPGHVTIFGQGGGAQKVIWLLASPLAKGLFDRAIVESGPNRNLDDNNTRVDTEEQAQIQSDSFVHKTGARNLEELREKNWRDLVAAMPAPPAGPEAAPAHDGRMHPAIDAWSLTDHPINIFGEALGNDVPILIGGDAQESNVFAGYAADWLPAITERKSKVYVYRFMHVPSKWKNAGLTAPSGLEVKYEFGDLAASWSVPLGVPPDSGFDKDDQTVAENTMKIWVQFAATGDPSVPGLVKWPVFKAASGEDKYVTIDVQPEVQSGFLEAFASGK